MLYKKGLAAERLGPRVYGLGRSQGLARTPLTRRQKPRLCVNWMPWTSARQLVRQTLEHVHDSNDVLGVCCLAEDSATAPGTMPRQMCASAKQVWLDAITLQD